MTVSSTFNANSGAGYERLMGRWSKLLAEPFLDFTGTADGENVLDVGCGTGHLAQTVARRNPSCDIQAIDFAPAYIEYARSHNHNSKIVFAVGDACALDFRAQTFDRVLSMLVLHFVPSSTQAVSEMHRVARPGAVVAACVWDARGGLVFNRMFFDTAAALDPDANERRAKNFTRPMTRPGELGKAWRDAGLLDVVETSISIRMEFSSFEDYWAPIDGRDGPLADYVATLGAAQRARLKDAVRNAYLDGEADGPRSYAAVAWAVKGKAPVSRGGSNR